MSTAVTVEHGRWACVTAGEYDRRTRRVVVNEAVVDGVEREAGHPAAQVRAAIVAHEVAHANADIGSRADDERRARRAAVEAAGVSVVEAIDRFLRKNRDADRSWC